MTIVEVFDFLNTAYSDNVFVKRFEPFGDIKVAKVKNVTCDIGNAFFCMSSPKYVSRNALKPLATLFEPLLKTLQF